jgi:phospholipid/cholesterol/gamma-HCH transport system substrate-binding protein
VNRGDGTIARLLNEPETVEKANAALETVDDSLSAFDTFFNRVGQTRFSFSIRSEYYGDSEATKNYFGFRLGLGPRNDRGFILELVDDNVGAPDFSTELTRRFDIDGNLIEETLEEKTTVSQAFRFSALLAGRFGNAQLRGGLMESSVGGGIDYFARDDRWRFFFEAWDFGREPDPHLKVGGSYTFFDRLLIILGYDDFLNDDLRQWYIGAGFAFR